MAKSERLGYVGVVGDGKNAARSFDALVRDNHGSIVQRTALEEDAFDETLVDVGIDDVSRIDDSAQSYVSLQHNQCTHLLLAHTHAGHHDGHHVFAVCILGGTMAEYASEYVLVLLRTDGGKEVANLFLEQDNQS